MGAGAGLAWAGGAELALAEDGGLAVTGATLAATAGAGLAEAAGAGSAVTAGAGLGGAAALGTVGVCARANDVAEAVVVLAAVVDTPGGEGAAGSAAPRSQIADVSAFSAPSSARLFVLAGAEFSAPAATDAVDAAVASDAVDAMFVGMAG